MMFNTSLVNAWKSGCSSERIWQLDILEVKQGIASGNVLSLSWLLFDDVLGVVTLISDLHYEHVTNTRWPQEVD